MALASAVLCHAVTDRVFDFDRDPAQTLRLHQNAEWRATGGNPSTGGYLALTDAANARSGIVVFDDFDDGIIVQGFRFKADLRVGNPAGNDGRPADGFSLCLAREDDPIVRKSDRGETPDGFADSAGGHEIGTRTGVSITFDAWSGNTLPDGPDIEGLIVRVDNATVSRVPLLLRNGACTDTRSIQTGPYRADSNGAPDALCWQELEVDLDESARITVKWKGATLLDKIQTSYLPGPGRWVFMGRTGSANQNQHLDHFRITTFPPSIPTLGAPTPRIDGLSVAIHDALDLRVDPESVRVLLDGFLVPSVSQRRGTTTTVLATVPEGGRFQAGSVHEIAVSFTDQTGAVYAEKRTFSAPIYGTLEAVNRADDVDTQRPGFRIRPHQVASRQPNSLAWTEEQLAGKHGSNRVDLAKAGIVGASSDGFVDWTDKPLDFRNATGGSGDFTFDYPLDRLGFPGFNPDGSRLANDDNAAVEVSCFVEFPAAGAYTMNVTSDDGFRLQTDRDARDLFSERLGEFDGGRAADTGTTFQVWVEAPGAYPFRLVWENGTGGAALEWSTVHADGSRSLVGDSADPRALRAYQARRQAVPYTSAVKPDFDAVQVHAQPVIEVSLENASQVIPESIQLAVNGTPIPITRIEVGSRWIVAGRPADPLLPGSRNVAHWSYTPVGQTPISRFWFFTVLPYRTSFPIDLIGDPETAVDPGFRIRTWQVNPARDQTDPDLRTPAELNYAEAMLAGKAGTNSANTASFLDAGYYVETGTINFSQPGPDGSPETTGFFPGDGPIPGIPGRGTANNDSVAMEALTYLAFPKPGFYLMGVTSDDGFKLTPGHAPGVLPLQVLAPTRLLGAIAAVPSVRGSSGGGGIFAPLPEVPIEAALVPVQGNDPSAPPNEGCGTALANAAAVQGKVAIIRRGTCSFLEKIRNANAAGAVAVIVYNNRSDPPLVMGGDENDIGIPALMIGRDIGANLATAVGGRVRIGADPAHVLGFRHLATPDSESRFGFRVEQPGVYPFRLLWQESQGSAHLEWYSITADGTRVLVNDGTHPEAIRAYRKAKLVSVPTLHVTGGAGDLRLVYRGILQAADAAHGPYRDVSGAPTNGTLTLPAIGNPRFFRSRM